MKWTENILKNGLRVLLKRISKVAFLYLKCFFNLRRTLINNQNVHNPEEAALIGA